MLLNDKTKNSENVNGKHSTWEVLKVSTKLGLTSFGGPIAHLGYFREEYVKRRDWIDEKSYADLVALCQFLPGPASSQVGISIGIHRAGLLGGIAAWLGFTLPSAVALVVFAYAVQGFHVEQASFVHGLMVAAVAVVAQAVLGMQRSLAPDRPRATIAILAAVLSLLIPNAFTQIAIILAAGWIGWRWLPRSAAADFRPIQVRIGRRAAILAWILFAALLVGLPLFRMVIRSQGLALFDTFYRVGSLVFGGGHVVLPMLQREVVPNGWMTNEQFLAGYGAAQAVPGPLFTFSAYLGAVIKSQPGGVRGAIIALVAMFLPSFLLVIGTLPFWNAIRQRPAVQSALSGVNSAVVGILLAALYNPVWTSAIHTAADFCLALVAFGLLVLWKLPPWIVVVVCAAGGMLISTA